MPSSEELRAQLAMVELEEALVAEKDAADDNAASKDTKAELREARRVYRELRAGHDPYEDAEPGDAVVQPEPSRPPPTPTRQGASKWPSRHPASSG